MAIPDRTKANARAGGPGHSGSHFDKPRSHHSTPIELVLRAIESATGIAPKRTGRGWRGPCPICGGKSLKVSIGESDTGAVLLHAFCGCPAVDIVQAVGLTLADLFPIRLNDSSVEGRRAARQMMREANIMAAMTAISHEARIVLVCAGDVRLGDLSATDLVRCAQAEQRIADALGAINVRLR